MEVRLFRSPVKKLLSFFVRSRDGWKQKCQKAKTRVKRLGNRVQKLTVSRDRWKERAQDLGSELAQARAELLELKIGGS
jgi:outer membrane murein-binding lipoprotein Lpp